MKIPTCIAAFLFVLLHTQAEETPAVNRTQKTFIPAMASVAGIRVGLDTIQTLERQIGSGLVCLGGHPHGGRCWQSTRMGRELYADGFNYNQKGGRVISSIIITEISKEDAHPAPAPLLPRASLLFMGKVGLGMSRQRVKEALQKILPPPEEKDNVLLWTAKGFSPLSDNHVDDVHEWQAKLTFKLDKLTEIFVSSDQS